ncbi:Thioredoxin-like protein 1 [Echinococcus granulosus]|uniref:Thioredoxin protein 1 n=1 Tax=Echinococcus granulosus TaxID=6210 RepID=U6JJX4_ECHGR|nr:Thioredoxin-like protein [Echinococcus granulosus]EUB57097.1 Thioredoxin-like protein [Echinococcus granulosus]KAH9279807.1 Thioredoxin-like protein 1 [Echinococcus granulosus]CDS24341.1 thioredoxin protein 1 [Echinococcus granulosus]
MSIKLVATDEAFKEAFKSASDDSARLVVLDFFATWCDPCTAIEPEVVELSRRFPSVSFIKVDVDTCSECVANFGVVQIPTFVFLRGGQTIETIRKPDMELLRARLNELTKSSGPPAASSSIPATSAPTIAPVPGLMDLVSMLDKTRCECLNCHSDHGLECALTKDMSYLMSDADEQLIIFLTFNQLVKLHSLRITGPEDSGPKNIKIFTNQTTTPDFDACEDAAPVQAFTLTPSHLKASSLIQLKYVRFQNVNSITIFIQDNQQGVEQTRITNLILYGCPVQNVTNMNEFKRVAGQKGEAHS